MHVTAESPLSANGALGAGQSNGLDRTAIMPGSLTVYSLSESQDKVVGRRYVRGEMMCSRIANWTSSEFVRRRRRSMILYL